MPRCSNRLIFLVLTLSAFTLYWGCSQPEDVISDVSTTKLTLTVERLPSLPDGMVYELWVYDGSNQVSLDKFSYDQVNRQFLVAGTDSVRSNEFLLNSDLFDYSLMFVSVENWPDANPSDNGPIMLVDIITDPSIDEIEMRFQNMDPAIGDATVRFNMEGVTDLNANANDGHGLWFTTYQRSTMEMPDTNQIWPSFDSVDLGTLELDIIYNNQLESVGVDTTNKDEIFATGLDWFNDSLVLKDSTFDTTLVTFGSDTIYLSAAPFYHIGYRMVFEIDSVLDPAVDTPDADGHYWDLEVVYDSLDTVSREIYLDIFSQDEFGLPDYGVGWKYKGWIVTPYYTNEVSARLIPPAWSYKTGDFSIIPGDTGALFTTGTFSNIAAPDDANPYGLIDSMMPKYPGEDFLNVTALQDSFGVDNVNFMPFPVGNEGTVFITLEPTNYVSDRNFPLFVFIKALPPGVRDDYIGGNLTQITMENWTHTIEANLTGFPRITVGVERF